MLQKIKNIKTLEFISVAYLVLPVLIYYFTFTKIVFALLTTLALLIIFVVALKQQNKLANVRFRIFSTKKNIIIFIISVLIICLWLFLTGVGDFTYQQTDYIKHNTVLKDLVANDWPFAYAANEANQPFVYYFAYYIPSALVGKVAGIQAANITFFIWTLIGCSIALCWIFKFFNRVSLCPILVLVCFGGLDFLGFIITSGGIPSIGSHLEWWAGILQFPSITNCLNFVPHMFVANLIIVPMLLYKIKNVECCYALYTCIAALPLWAPFILLGIVPFFAFYIVKLLINRTRLITIFNPAVVITCFYFAIIPILFILSNSQAAGDYTGFIWEFDEAGNIGWLLPLVLVLEFVIPIVTIFALKKKLQDKTSIGNFAIVYICIGEIIVCSLIHVGLWNDFCMRVSMPSTLILALFFTECIHLLWVKYKNTGEILPFVWTVALLLVMEFTPFNEFVLRALEKPMSVEEYSTANLTKYLYPYQYMSPNEDNFYQNFISNELNYFDSETPGTGIDFTQQLNGGSND